ncbi:MAG: HlyC/CorC family transporter [Anaerolineae bacterium]|nr:HlyC/CorC family transporter [Anaerolineae bacterium]
MAESSLLLILLLAALGIHGAVSLMNAALQNLSRADMRLRADDGDARAQRYLALMDSGLQLSMTVGIAHILTRFAIAVILVLLVIEPLANGDAGVRALLAVATIVLGTALTLVIGDLLPEAIGSSQAENLLALALPSMRLLFFVISPFTALVLFLSRLISRAFGSDTLVNLVTEEEIMTLVHASHSGGIIEAEEKDMIASVLQLGESSARELMTPRIDIVALDVDDTIMQALSAFVESGFSRIPIYEESIDSVIGLLYAKDILTVLKNRDDLESQKIRDLLRPTYYVPETKRADALLKELQEKNVHLAIVVDEYGGTSGLEEIIGDIRDEYDYLEEEDYVEVGDGFYLIDASMDLDDLNDLLGCSIDTANADTLGGYIYLTLGRVPRTNETIETDILNMTVLSIDGHRIRKVKVRAIAPAPQTGEIAKPAGNGIIGSEKISAHGK